MPSQLPRFEAEQGLEGASNTPDLWSFKVGQLWLLCWPSWPASCLHPMCDSIHHDAPCPIHQRQTDADRQVFLQLFSSLSRKWALDNEGMSEICPFPAFWQLWEEREDHLTRRWGGQKSFWTEKQKRWNVKPGAHRSEANFPWNPMRPVLLHQEQGAERSRSLKTFKRKLAFCFLSCTAD